MILHPLFLTQNGIKAFCVEIAIVDFVAARPQSCDDLGMQCCAEADTNWIGIQNKNAQRRAPVGDAAETGFVLPLPLSVTTGIPVQTALSHS
jgi:hypothetical protein